MQVNRKAGACHDQRQFPVLIEGVVGIGRPIRICEIANGDRCARDGGTAATYAKATVIADIKEKRLGERLSGFVSLRQRHAAVTCACFIKDEQ